VRQILMQTADRIETLERERQGFGLVNPLRAVERAQGQPHRSARTNWFSPPRREGRHVVFRHFRPLARQVAVAGDFTGWEPKVCHRNAQGLWTLTCDLPDGVYQYKLVVDDVWREDPSNLRVTPDGMGGVNSVLELLR
jgi:1,4-alpha-glucan branching enzyme